MSLPLYPLGKIATQYQWFKSYIIIKLIHHNLVYCRQFLGPVISGALTEAFDFQTSSLVRESQGD